MPTCLLKSLKLEFRLTPAKVQEQHHAEQGQAAPSRLDTPKRLLAASILHLEALVEIVITSVAIKISQGVQEGGGVLRFSTLCGLRRDKTDPFMSLFAAMMLAINVDMLMTARSRERPRQQPQRR